MGAKITENTVSSGLKRELLKISTQQNRVLKAGASTLIPLLRKNTPKGEQTRHAKDHIGVSRIKSDSNSFEKYVTIGYEKGYSHRIHTSEFGTMYQRPQLFITKTEREGRVGVIAAMATSMKRGLR